MLAKAKKTIKFLFLKMGLSVRFAKNVRNPEISFLELLSKKIDCILYVGANRGQMMETYISYFPGTQIVMYEADPRLSDFLKSKYSGELISIRNKAIGANIGKAPFYISPGTDGQSSSLLKMGGRHLQWSPESAQRHTVEVETVSLDSENFSKHHSIFLKIDIQGFELEALKGASTLLKKIVAIDIEVSFVSLYENDSTWLEISNYLSLFDFQLYDINPWFHDIKNRSEILQADFRFVKRHLLSQ